jgi:hypothetical protein
VTRPLDSLEDDFHRGSLLLVTLQQLVLFAIQLFQALGQIYGMWITSGRQGITSRS